MDKCCSKRTQSAKPLAPRTVGLSVSIVSVYDHVSNILQETNHLILCHLSRRSNFALYRQYGASNISFFKNYFTLGLK